MYFPRQMIYDGAYVASSRDLTYSPAVMTSYLLGDPGVTQVGIGWAITIGQKKWIN